VSQVPTIVDPSEQVSTVEAFASSDNPCLSCGACCAAFRVSFYWREADGGESGGAVPPALWTTCVGMLSAL